MPNGDATAFPKFPSAFTEGEQERLIKLKEQRKEFETSFRGGLTPQAFQELPAWQRIPRAAAGEAFTRFPFSLATDLIPGIMGQLTPELARERKEELDLEIFELERKQRVVNRIPYIQAELTLLALLGEGIEDPAVLTSIFQDLGKDFTPEEEAWVTAFAARLAITTPEAILAGKVPGIGDTLPLSEADLAAWIKDKDIQPSQVLTTVSLSQDIEDVSAALRAMFIPQEPEKEKKLPEQMMKDFSAFFRNLAIEQGIIPKEGESDKELADRVKEEVGLREGWRDTVRVGVGAGAGLIQLEVMSDNSTFYDNGIGKEKVATYDPDTKKYHPLPEKELEDATDQIPFSMVTEEGEELDLVWKMSDSTIWLGQEQIGHIDEEGTFVPRELRWWEEVLGRVPEPILNGVFGALDVAFAVPTFVGAGIGYLGSEFEKRAAMTDEEWKAYKDDIPMSSFGDFGQFLPGGEQAQRYFASPLWTQMVLSVPFWVGMGVAGIPLPGPEQL